MKMSKKHLRHIFLSEDPNRTRRPSKFDGKFLLSELEKDRAVSVE